MIDDLLMGLPHCMIEMIGSFSLTFMAMNSGSKIQRPGKGIRNKITLPTFLSSPWFFLGYFLLINILFYLPGSAFPKDNILTRIYFDKWVHLGIFAALVFLWRSAFHFRFRGYHALILLAAMVYGMLVELIQDRWVTNRSYDPYDFLADVAGSFLGLYVWWRVYKKNKPL